MATIFWKLHTYLASQLHILVHVTWETVFVHVHVHTILKLDGLAIHYRGVAVGGALM